MAQQTEILSYTIDNFLKYKEKNTSMPQDLLPYCYNNKTFHCPNISQYVEHMKLIFDNVSKGINTNDMIFKSDVKYLVNTINKKNFGDALNKLKSLNYSSRENVQFLAHELIVCSMRCPIGIKGIHKEKNSKSKSLSEVLSDVIRYFCNHLTKENNNRIGFHDELLKLCGRFFMDFISLTKSMDQNNENTSDNYKGFMTLLGLMYENNLVPHKIVMECVDSIKRTIFCSKISQKKEQISNSLTEQHQKMFGYKKAFDSELYDYIVYFDTKDCSESDKGRYICYRNTTECTNFYKGYENFAQHYSNSFVHKINDYSKNLKYYNTILNNLNNNQNSEIINSYFLENELDNSPEKYNDNIQTLITKYTNQLNNLKSQITKQIGFLENFIKEHDEFTKLNETYKILNKDQLSSPLKPHIMLIHDEISQNLHKSYDELILLQ
jgi:hypothetical protein